MRIIAPHMLAPGADNHHQSVDNMETRMEEDEGLHTGVSHQHSMQSQPPECGSSRASSSSRMLTDSQTDSHRSFKARVSAPMDNVRKQGGDGRQGGDRQGPRVDPHRSSTSATHCTTARRSSAASNIENRRSRSTYNGKQGCWSPQSVAVPRSQLMEECQDDAAGGEIGQSVAASTRNGKSTSDSRCSCCGGLQMSVEIGEVVKEFTQCWGCCDNSSLHTLENDPHNRFGPYQGS